MRIAIVVTPVAVPVPLVAIPVEVQRVPVAVGTLLVCTKSHPLHHHPITQVAEFYSAS